MNGVATFPKLAFKKAGIYTLEATDGRLPAIVSGALSVVPATATRIVFEHEPTAISIDSDFSVEVEFFDKFGNLATNDASFVSISDSIHPVDATLQGTLEEPVVGGLADFSELYVDNPGEYRFMVNDSAIVPPIKSKTFRIA